MDPLYRFIAHRPGWVITLFLGATLVVAAQVWDFRAGAPRLHVETAVNRILPEGDDERRFYDHFRERFGNDEVVVIVLIDDDVLSAASLSRIQRMSERFAKVEGVRRVLSLANALDIRAEDGDVRIEPFFQDLPTEATQLELVRSHIRANPLMANNLVASDRRAAAFLIYPEDMSEMEFRRRGIDQTLERIAQEERGSAKAVMGGAPPVKATTSRLVIRDAALTTSLGFLLTAVVGFVTFRSVRGLWLPLACIGIGQLWTFGLMALSGRSLNLVTSVVPPVINAVGTAYCMHVLAEHDDVVREHGPSIGREAVFIALKRVAFAVWLCGLTTAAGFLSLCTNPLGAIREFGLFCAIGDSVCTLAALIFVPAVLALRPPKIRSETVGQPLPIEAWAARVAGMAVRRRNAVFAAFGVLAVIALAGLPRIVVDTALSENLHPSHPLRQGILAIDEHLHGANTVNVVVGADSPNVFKRPESLQQLRELQDWLDQQPEVGRTISLADYLMLINQAFHDGDPAEHVIPASERLVTQLLFFFWDEQLDDLVDADFSSASIQVRVHSMTSSGYGQLVERIRHQMETLPPELPGRVTGNTVLAAAAIDDIARGQAISLATGLISILAILVWFFRSFRLGALALLPNALPVLAYFGALGLFGITLNVTTALVGCIVLGVAVDDTTHYLVRFQENLRASGDEKQSAIDALRTLARPVTATTISLCLGFLILLTSSLKHQVEFGMLAAGTLAFAWLTEVTLTPALASRLGALASRIRGGAT
jgi:predicted RND superfamily exporter protein